MKQLIMHHKFVISTIGKMHTVVVEELQAAVGDDFSGFDPFIFGESGRKNAPVRICVEVPCFFSTRGREGVNFLANTDDFLSDF